MNPSHPSESGPKGVQDENISAEVETTHTPESGTINGGDNASDADKLRNGALLGKYEIRKLLGRGGMGAVYLAFDSMIEREVAIKVLPPSIASSPRVLQRFLAEARATGKLNHPNVVSIYDIGQAGDLHFIVMELLTGGSVADLIAEGRTLPWREACRITLSAAEGLAAAHDAGLVHRDVKPENLMLAHDGMVKVVDFGLAKLIDGAEVARTAMTIPGQVLGTPAYMSPEQFRSESVDAGSDIYSLGGTLFRLLTGQTPFEKAETIIKLMYAHLEQSVRDPGELVSGLPSGCGAVIQRAMTKQRNERYESMQEMAGQIRNLLESSSHLEEKSPERFAETAPAAPRALQSALIVERSKMQAAVLKSHLQKAGLTRIDVVSDITGAMAIINERVADLVVTSLHLPDGTGSELICALREDFRFDRSFLVLNSTDLNWDDALAPSKAGAVAFVSKQTKPDEILRAIHACTDFEIGSRPFAAELDANTFRLLIVSDAHKMPEQLAEAIRELQLLDVQVVKTGEWKLANGPFDLTLYVLPQPVGSEDRAAELRRLFGAGGPSNEQTTATLAIVAADGSSCRLIGTQRSRCITLCEIDLDTNRLRRLSQL